MDSSLDQFTFNSRPAAANFQRSSKEQSRPDKEQYKYTVIICNNTNSVCQYCHIKIKQKDLMLMTKSQRTTNDFMKSPCYYGYHCDCFFLSSNVCKGITELYGYGSLSKYHRQYIARKISKSQSKSQAASSRELPSDLKVGYSILDRRFNYYCEQCNMAMLPSDIKIAGILKKHNDMVVYHPRCFSQAFNKHPIKLEGMDKLLPYDVSGLRSMLNIIDPGASYDRYPDQSTQIESVMKFKTSKDAFLWPRDNPSSAAPPRREHEQNRSSSSYSSSASSKIWDSIQSPRSQPSYHHSNHPDYKSSRSKPSQFDELLRDHMNRKSDSEPKNPNESCRSEDCAPKPLYIRAPNTTSMTECSRKRKTSFKPNTDHLSSRLSNHGNDLKKIINQQPPKRDRSHDSPRASSSDSQSESSKKSHSETSESSGKVELKKSTIRSEITKILYKYNHDYITSKIVRTMLMQKFGCDLTPHKKYIDDTIMELLDIIDNNPINLKSIPGRVFVEEGEIEDVISTSPVSPAPGVESPIMSPMSANIDDISPFAIMGNQVDEIALSNVDNSVNTNTSKSAWGDKSNSPKDKEKSKSDASDTNQEKEVSVCPEREQEVEKEGGRKYALSATDKPINLCECCLCCFRIQTLEEVVSLYNHVQTKHGAERRCVVCDIKFKDVYALMLHVAEFHRGNKSFRCKNCNVSFNHHAELSKHLDFCFLSSESEDLEESSDKSPRKKSKGPPGMPELVNTLKNTQYTLDKIKTFITSESGQPL